MKRFFCTGCKKVKRVRRLPPLDTTSFYHNEETDERELQPLVAARLGLCKHHTADRSRTEGQDRLRVLGQRSAMNRRKK